MRDDTISRTAALDALGERPMLWINNDEYTLGARNQYDMDRLAIETVPSAQPETAKRIVGKSRDGMTLWYQCDMCGEPVDAQDNFCRGCGRRLTDG